MFDNHRAYDLQQTFKPAIDLPAAQKIALKREPTDSKYQQDHKRNGNEYVDYTSKLISSFWDAHMYNLTPGGFHVEYDFDAAGKVTSMDISLGW